MATILDHRTALDQTIRIYDSFYAFNLIINGNEYDVVRSYFVSVCSTINIADNFTALFFRIAQELQIPATDLLALIKGKKKMEINQTLAYYLNSFKSKTSLYGIAIEPKSNQSVARNIVQ